MSLLADLSVIFFTWQGVARRSTVSFSYWSPLFVIELHLQPCPQSISTPCVTVGSNRSPRRSHASCAGSVLPRR
ncbi:hypothetical protein BC826DRAFT_989397 [Russula brevipes]|nr:hypothetical protein BC826DRAFT_989397 [Russula brevipes]